MKNMCITGLSHLNFNIFYTANRQIFMDGYSKNFKPQRIFADLPYPILGIMIYMVQPTCKQTRITKINCN